METSTSSRDVRTWNVLCHATALAGFFVPWAGHILGPLIVWLAKRSDSPEIDEYGKESLNFQISMLIYNVIAGVLCLVLVGFINCGGSSKISLRSKDSFNSFAKNRGVS